MLYLDLPTPAQIERLAETRGPAAVTIYLATTPVTQQADLARISLKNHQREAIAQLQAADTPKRTIWPIEEFLESLDDDEDFWAHQAHSLAVFVTPERMRTFRLANRLEDQVHVADRFHLKPLLRATSFANDAWVLALSEGGVRLIAVPAEGRAEQVRLQGAPRDANHALGLATLNDRAPKRRIQGSEGKNLRLRQYVRMVDAAVSAVIRDSDRPLILAAAEPLRTMFAQQTDYPALAEEAIEGNADHKSADALADEARPILTHLQQQKVAQLRDLYAERAGSGRASSDLAQVGRAATAGAVDTLMVDMDSVTPGTLDAEGRVSHADASGADSYGIADAIAMRVLRNGGRVMSVRAADLPDANSPVAAVLRYAM